ncbi:MAG: MFS transporter [Bacillota bacterium]|nr:MFS transporter [Bacillota bacterium]
MAGLKGVIYYLKMRLRNLPIYYGWVIVGLMFFAITTNGIRGSFGAYFTSWESEFLVSRTIVTLISIISWITFAIFQPIIGKMNDRFGSRAVISVSLLLIGLSLILSSVSTQIWQLTLFLGIMATLGFAGSSNVTATSLVSQWFVEKQGLVLGFIVSGMAVGHLFIVPISLYLISNYSWRVSMFSIGLAVTCVLVPLCYGLIRSKPEDIGLVQYGKVTVNEHEHSAVSFKEKVQVSSIFIIMKDPVFWKLTIPYFFCGFTDVGLIGTHFIPFAEMQFSVVVIAIAYSLIAGFNIFGTISTGYLSDKIHRSNLLAYIYFIRGVTFCILIFAKTPLWLFVFAALYGATEMASIAPTSSLCINLFKNASIGMIFGFVSVSHHLGAALGSFFAGITYDLYGSYTFIFILSIILIWGSAVLVAKVPDLRKIPENSVNAQNS